MGPFKPEMARFRPGMDSFGPSVGPLILTLFVENSGPLEKSWRNPPSLLILDGRYFRDPGSLPPPPSSENPAATSVQKQFRDGIFNNLNAMKEEHKMFPCPNVSLFMRRG